MIVVCSPQTPKSRWVCEEVEQFCALGRRSHVFPVLIEGNEGLSFPPILRSGPEPLYIDLRAESRRQQIKKLKSERLRLAAAILECRYDDLRQRDQQRKIRRRGLLAGIMLVLAVIFAILSVALVVANRREKAAKDTATSNMNLALDSVSRILSFIRLKDDDRQREVMYLSRAATALERVLEQDPMNIKAMTNLRSIHATIADIAERERQPRRAKKALAQAVALRLPLALARLHAWNSQIPPEIAPADVEAIRKEMALAEQIQTRTPDSAVRYLDTAIELATSLDTSTLAGRSEAQRLLEKGIHWLEDSEQAEGFTSEHRKLLTALRQKLQNLSKQ